MRFLLARMAQLIVRRTELLLVAEVVTYSVVFSYLLSLKFHAFQVYAWDFGVYAQAIHTTVSSGTLFFSTVELPYTSGVLPFGTQLAVHFSPFLFLVLPFYMAVPSPTTLLAIKSIVIALGAIPIFLMAKWKLSSLKLGLLFSTSYLLLPALQGVNWFDFQPQAFFPTFVLFALFYMEKQQLKPTLAFLLLAFSTVEIAPLLGIAIGLSSMLSNGKFVEMIKRGQLIRLLKSTQVLIILVACTWLTIFYLLSIALGWEASFHPSNTRRISLLTSLSLTEALAFDWQSKVVFLALIFGPLAFLGFFDIRRVLPATLWLFVAVFSNYPPYYQLSVHYPFLVVPFVAYASVFGFARARRLFPRLKRLLPLLLCATILTSFVVASPLGSLHWGNWPGGSPGLPQISTHDILLQGLVDLIPTSASILAQNNIFPHVSDREDAYVIPFAATFPSPDSFGPTLDSYIRAVEYVLVDPTTDQAASITALRRVSQMGGFGIYAEADGAILMKRGHLGPPSHFVPFIRTYDQSDLIYRSGEVIEDPSSVSKRVFCRTQSDPSSDFWHGPGVFLARGTYSVTFHMKATASTAFDALVLAVIAWPVNVTIQMKGSPTLWYVPDVTLNSLPQTTAAAMQIESQSLSPFGQYQSLQLEFSVDTPSGYEFVGLNAQSGVSLCLDYVELLQASP